MRVVDDWRRGGDLFLSPENIERVGFCGGDEFYNKGVNVMC